MTLLSALGLLAATAACEKASPARPTDLQAADAAPVSVTDARTGVTIVAGRPVSPEAGAEISWANQPITLTITNAVSTGKTALTYSFEVATDAAFTARVYSKDGVTPGSGNQTSVRIDTLPGSNTYYWRVTVMSGTTVGPNSAVRSFTVGPEVILGIPSPLAPTNNGTAFAPIVLTTSNVSRIGPAGAIAYRFEVATSSSSFANPVFSTTTVEGSNNRTSVTVTSDLTAGATYFWRVQASDATNGITTPFSSVFGFEVQSFGSGGDGGSATDMMNLASAEVHGGPADVASWPATTAITRITMSPAEGFAFEFSARATWPDYTPPGWDGPIQYTVWPVVQVNGLWHIAACVRMWREKASTGEFGLPTWHDHFPAHWSYNRGPEMAGYRPNPGDQMGFFVTAGNARFQTGVTSLRERSNVVLFTLPAGDVGVFTFQ